MHMTGNQRTGGGRWAGICGAVLTFIAVHCAGCAPRAETWAAPAEERTAEVAVLFRREYSGPVRPGGRYMHLDLMPRPGEITGFYSANEGSLTNALWGAPGRVYTGAELVARRPQYTDVNRAKHFRDLGRPDLRIVTDWVRLRVTPAQQEALARAVERMRSRQPYFHLAGHNCVSRAAECLQAAGIIPGGVPLTDNGENLLKHLRRHYPDLTMETGFFGLDAAGRPFMEGL